MSTCMKWPPKPARACRQAAGQAADYLDDEVRPPRPASCTSCRERHTLFEESVSLCASIALLP